MQACEKREHVMNPISNSVIKERFRQNNDAIARNEEVQIQSRLNREISELHTKNKYEVGGFLIGGGVAGIVVALAGVGFAGLAIGILGGLILWGILNASVNSFNQSIENKKQSLHTAAMREIAAAYDESDRRTVSQINAYDREVKTYSEKILKNADGISPMVSHNADMFQRMISHADSGAHMRFVEADFIYEVLKDGVKYIYQSKYTNPQDDFNFNRQRYRDLKSEAECEGLAQALAKLTAAKMKTFYPANSMKINVSHNDSKVTMHFQGANANFVPARDIL